MIDDIKLNKDIKKPLRSRIWRKLKIYTIVGVFGFLLINSDLYDITIVKEDNQIIYELCIDRESIKKDFRCLKSFMYTGIK